MSYLRSGGMGGLFGSSATTHTSERFQIPDTDIHIHIMLADITKLPVDCIVNAAQNALLGGGGVDGAIHRAAGAGLMRACFVEPAKGRLSYSRCETGEAVLTPGPFGKNLLAVDVIHTVGPIVSRFSLEEGKEKLHSCVVSCLKIAKDRKYRSIAFPAISCGIYNGIGDKWLITAAFINISACRENIATSDSLKHIVFAFTDADIYQAWREAVLKILYNIPEKLPLQIQPVPLSRNISPGATYKQQQGGGKGSIAKMTSAKSGEKRKSTVSTEADSKSEAKIEASAAAGHRGIYTSDTALSDQDEKHMLDRAIAASLEPTASASTGADGVGASSSTPTSGDGDTNTSGRLGCSSQPQQQTGLYRDALLRCSATSGSAEGVVDSSRGHVSIEHMSAEEMVEYSKKLAEEDSYHSLSRQYNCSGWTRSTPHATTTTPGYTADSMESSTNTEMTDMKEGDTMSLSSRFTRQQGKNKKSTDSDPTVSDMMYG